MSSAHTESLNSPDDRVSSSPRQSTALDSSGSLESADSASPHPDISKESSDASASKKQGIEASSPEHHAPSLSQEIEIFITTFFTILVAELGDKTQLTTLLMSAESQSPWIVFLGAGTALILTTLVGVLVGRWLAQRVSVETLETTTGVILTLISIMLLWDVVNL